MNRRARPLRGIDEVFENVLAKLVDGQIRRVHNLVGEPSNGCELCLFMLDRVFERIVVTISLKRMRPAALAEPPNEDVVARDQEHHRGWETSLFQPLMRFGEILQKTALADIGDDGDAVDLPAFGGELGKGQDELRGKVVDAEKTGVLESLHRERLSRTGKTGNENEKSTRRFRHTTGQL